MPQNLIQKIAQRFAVGLPPEHEVHSGDFLSIRPLHVMTHDNTAAVISKFRSMGAARVDDPDQPVFALDHDIQNTSPENLAKYAKIEQFAREHGVAFHPVGRGIGHQIMIEEGFVLPGSFVVGSDSHSNIYGALAALGTPVVRTDAAAIWATGRTWWQVPDVVKVNLTGELQPGVSGKDVIIALIGTFNKDEVLNCCLEFAGPGVASLTIEERMTIANMTTEWGALAGVFPYDDVIREYLLARAERFQLRGDKQPCLTRALLEKLEADLPGADPDAVYAKELDFDLSAVTPFVAGPNEVKTITPLPEIEHRNVRIDKAFLMSCVNGRLQDFQAAAEVIKGRRVAGHVKFYIAAASSEVEAQAKEKGHWQALVDAGAIALPPGCGACIGLGEGVLEAGEVGISATNRNFKGRMGARDSLVYLASPVVVAASAIAGKIAGPKYLDQLKTGPTADVAAGAPAGRHPERAQRPEDLARLAKCRQIPRSARNDKVPVQILPGFPEKIEGELLLVPKDNLNTDGIYGKDYTYKEDMTPEQMAAVAMQNYDPQFQSLAREGDILVGGYNFGSGSSREQAATALKYRGLQMIIAGSFSQTYKRNAFNNGFVCIECPELVDDLKAAYKDNKAPTIRTGWNATVDFTKSQIVAAGPRTGRDVAVGGSLADVASAPRGRRNVAAGLRPGRGLEGEAPAEPRTYSFAPLGQIAQELIVKGGFEAVIREQLASMK